MDAQKRVMRLHSQATQTNSHYVEADNSIVRRLMSAPEITILQPMGTSIVKCATMSHKLILRWRKKSTTPLILHLKGRTPVHTQRRSRPTCRYKYTDRPPMLHLFLFCVHIFSLAARAACWVPRLDYNQCTTFTAGVVIDAAVRLPSALSGSLKAQSHCGIGSNAVI
jgi:hypothetical protein